MQRLASGHIQAVLELGNFGAHRAQVFHHKSNAVRLLDPQLLCIADADAAAREGRNGCQYRQFIDELRGQRAADLRRSQALGRSRNPYCTD